MYKDSRQQKGYEMKRRVMNSRYQIFKSLTQNKGLTFALEFLYEEGKMTRTYIMKRFEREFNIPLEIK